MAAYFGLHVGATSISIAVSKDKHTEVLANDAGDRVIPAFLSYNEGEMAVGVYSSRNFANIISCCKRLLGYTDVNYDEVQTVQKYCPCKIIKLSNKDELGYELKNGDGKVAEIIGVKTALRQIFNQLMDTAARHIGISGDSYAVLAVPIEFNENQKQLIKEAATASGFKVLQLIGEPSAAISACQLDNVDKDYMKNRLAVVYRAGGTSVTVTVFSVYNGYYRVLATVNRSNLGGETVTDLLVEHLCEEFQRLQRVDIRSKNRSLHKLRLAAENCKRVLSSVTTMTCSVESLHDGIDFLCNFSRARLESLLTTLIPKFLEPLEEVFTNNSNLLADDIDMLIFCGGTCKTPLLQQALSNCLSKAEIVQPNAPDEILAAGAAFQAEHFKGLEDTINNLDEEFIIQTITNSLYFKLSENGENKLVFEKGTPVPVEKNEIVQLSDEQGELHILEIDDSSSDHKEKSIAKISMEDLAENTVSIRFNMKVNNTMEIMMTCKDFSRSFTIF